MKTIRGRVMQGIALTAAISKPVDFNESCYNGSPWGGVSSSALGWDKTRRQKRNRSNKIKSKQRKSC